MSVLRSRDESNQKDSESRRLTLLSATEWEVVSELQEGFAKALIARSSGMDGCLTHF